ncbi:MAG: HEAT repeat domain-containing protein, partial [Planctomycetes bacterium]|nr:HEAT repeat domain-containing protein [Planctomycetota bacterium]
MKTRFLNVVIVMAGLIAGLGMLSQRDSELVAGDKDRPSSQSGSLRVAPKEPAKAVKTFEVLDGFQMQLVAHEPNVTEPIVISYDENGLLYVAEYLKFPSYDVKGKRATGRIRLLRDRDGDGKYEESHVFADGLEWPTGICPWKGGVFVIAAPDLWYLKDTNGDDVADVKKKIYTGFGFNNEEGTANNLVWGLDHWIYGAGSNSGGEIRPADKPAARAVSLRGLDFRFHPATEKFEAISGSEQFGNTFDDWNNRFICQNSKPAVHVVLPARYLQRNPYLPVPAVRRNIWQGERVFRASPPEPWRLARSKLRLAQPRKWAATYVSHDVFTACTGVTIYRGAAYPKKYHGNLFVGDVQGNLVHRRVMQPNGVSFDSRRADQNTEMVRSKDNWFRPANMTNAPDGTLHIVDMYREVIETPDSLPDEILSRIDLLSGSKRGRIYRLAPPGFKVPPQPQLGSVSTEELVSELENRNGWWRDTVGRLIYERQDLTAVQPLRALLRTSKFALARLHAMYALHGLGSLRDDDLVRLLSDSSPGVREHAVRLAESRLPKSSDLLIQRVLALADDADMRVRFQVAFSLGNMNDPRAAQALSKIARRDAKDIWMRTAVLSSSLNQAAGMLEQLLAEDDFASSSAGQQFLRQLALVVGGRKRKSEIENVLKLIETSPVAKKPAVRRSLILGLGDGLRRSRSGLSLYVKNSPSAAALLAGLIQTAKQTLANSSSSARQREQAIEMLAHGSFRNVRGSLVSMLDTKQAPAVQLAAVHTLAGFGAAEVPIALIDAWRSLSPTVRHEVVESLLSRSEWINALIDAVEANKISPGDIDPVRKALLVKHNDPKIRTHAAKLFSTDALSPRKSVVDAYRPALTLAGSVESGKQVFEKNCMTCHKVAGRGKDVGPNLAVIQNRTREGLMIQILDPNREVLANYTQYVVVLDDGRVVSGLIASESPSSITLRGSAETDTELTFSISTAPRQGTLGTIGNSQGQTATVVYTPNLGFRGTDTFEVVATDGIGESQRTTITVEVMKRFIPWLELNNNLGDIEDSLIGINIWSQVTDTVIITTSRATLENRLLYPELVAGSPANVRIIGGIKTSDYIPGAVPAIVDEYDFADRDAWTLIAQHARQIVEVTGTNIIVLENETAAHLYHAGHATIDYDKLKESLLPLADTGIEFWWYLPQVNYDTPGFPDRLLETTAFVTAIIDVLPGTKFNTLYTSFRGWKGHGLIEPYRIAMMGLVGLENMNEMLYVTQDGYLGDRYYYNTAQATEQIREVLPTENVNIVYTGASNWVTVAEE